jgi:adenine/guanine/hypoxanthine permease
VLGVHRVDRFFEISARKSTVAAELRGGVVTFIAIAYIIVLNPIILSTEDVTGGRLEFTQVSAMTSLAAGVMTILFGVISRLPFAFAAGLGINSFLATTVVGSLTWPEAMGLVVINGLIIVALAVTGLRRLIFDAVPMQLKLAVTAGIGLFIFFIGLVDAGFIGSTGEPSPPVGLGIGGIGSINAVPTVVFAFTLLVTGILVVRRVRGGILIGLVAGTVVAIVIEAIWHLGSATERPGGWSLSVPALSGSPFALPDLSLIGDVSFGSFGHIGVLAAVMLVFTLVFANFFDAMGSFTGLAREAGLADAQGTFPRLRSALIVEGAGAVVGGVTSSSSNTVFVESGAGRGRRAHRLGQPRHRCPVSRRDVRRAAGDNRADRGCRCSTGNRWHDDGFALTPYRHLRVLGGPAGRAHCGDHAVFLLDRQWHWCGVHFVGAAAVGGEQGARDQPAALDRRRRLRALLRAQLDRVAHWLVT